MGMENDGLKIPDFLLDKVVSFPESSMGANRIKMILRDGTRVHNVVVAGDGTIVKIGNRTIKKQADIEFRISDIANVISEIK